MASSSRVNVSHRIFGENLIVTCVCMCVCVCVCVLGHISNTRLQSGARDE